MAVLDTRGQGDHAPARITLDFETRSELDINKVGSWLYSKHPSTEVLCLAYKQGDWKGLWVPGLPFPKELLLRLCFSPILKAHNAAFEMYMWQNCCMPKYGFPDVPSSWWWCTAAQAAACSLPRDLGRAADVLGLKNQKDNAGKKEMLKLSKPRKATKKNPAKWHDESPEDLEKLYDYCMDDVEAEDELAGAIPELSARERDVWAMTERMNSRGVAVDMEGVAAARKISSEYMETLRHEFYDITGIDSPTKREKLHTWLATQGLSIDNTTAPVLDRCIKSWEPGPPRRALQIMRAAGRTSTKKYDRMHEMADEDARIRGMFLYHGANTGRWSGRGVQVHNFPRGKIKDMDQAWEIIRQGDYRAIEAFDVDPMDFISWGLRGALWAPRGRKLQCGDYAAIECRVTFWMAGEEGGLDVFRRHEDIYCDMASTIYGYPVIDKLLQAAERFLGKQAILGLGFGMGFIKFLVHCRSFGVKFTPDQILKIMDRAELNYKVNWIRTKRMDFVRKMMPGFMDEDLPELAMMLKVVETYRARFEKVTQMWTKMEECFKYACKNPGQVYKACGTKWVKRGRFLHCKLPSGRIIYYPDAGVDGKNCYYRGLDDKNRWMIIDTYGGKLTENVVQATARDCMVESMFRLEATKPYEELVLTVHDELVSEMDEEQGNLSEFLRIMSEPPEWAPDLPVECEGWEGKRYRK